MAAQDAGAGGSEANPLVVLGPGAVGGLLAALLSRDGTDVVVSGRPATVAAVARDGLNVRSQALGSWTGRPVASTEIPRGADVVLAVKSFALPAVLDQLVAARPSSVLTVLNGIGHVPVLAEALPATRVIPAAIIVEARRDGAVIEHRSTFLRLFVPDAAVAHASVRALQSAGVEVCPGGSEVEVLWRKFRFLAPMALLTALHREPIGPALARDPALTAHVLAEVAGTATAAGMATTEAELTGILVGLPPAMRSSLQLDLASGGETELDAVGGGLLDVAVRLGVAVPACARIVATLRTVPARGWSPSPTS